MVHIEFKDGQVYSSDSATWKKIGKHLIIYEGEKSYNFPFFTIKKYNLPMNKKR